MIRKIILKITIKNVFQFSNVLQIMSTFNKIILNLYLILTVILPKIKIVNRNIFQNYKNVIMNE